MIVRAATAADVPAMALILGDWVREVGWMPVLHSRADDAGFCHHLVATQTVLVLDDGALAGFQACKGDQVNALYLAPRARGQRWGRVMLAKAQDMTDRLALWTFQANLGAQAFYARAGFVAVAWGDGSGNEERLPDVRMEWRRRAA